MERVLSCYETVHLILDYLYHDRDNKSLARGARVCRRWFDPAIANLWRSLEHVHVLFNLLPGSGSGPYKNHISSMRGSIDRTRFDLYAKYVKILNVYINEGFGITHATLARLAYTQSLQCLLPNIEDLEVRIHGFDKYFLDILFFIGPSLRRLSIYDMSILNFYDIFNCILPRTPYLVSLTLSAEEHNEELPFQEDFILALRGLLLLEELITVGCKLTPDLIVSLALLPSLRIIDHEVHSSETDVDAGSSHELFVTLARDLKEPFPCLNEIQLSSDMAVFKFFLSLGFYFPKIKKLDAIIQGEFTDIILQECFEIIASEWNNISDLGFDLLDRGREILHFPVFQPLADLRGLRRFYVSSITPIALTNDDLDRLVRSWPDLMEFKLDFELHILPPHLTLSALTSFAVHCKKIEHIFISVDAVPNIDVPSHVPILKNLQQIAFGDSPISDPDMVVLLLSRFIPLTCEVNRDYDRQRIPDGPTEGRDFKDRWLRVCRLFKLIRKVLEQQTRQSIESFESV